MWTGKRSDQQNKHGYLQLSHHLLCSRDVRPWSCAHCGPTTGNLSLPTLQALWLAEVQLFVTDIDSNLFRVYIPDEVVAPLTTNLKYESILRLNMIVCNSDGRSSFWKKQEGIKEGLILNSSSFSHSEPSVKKRD